MFTTTAPDRDPAAGPDLAIRRVARRRFPGAAAFADRPGHQEHLRDYLADLARPYGVPLREEVFREREGHSYGEMGAALAAEAVPPEEPVDLLVLAFAVPDIRPGRAVATYLSEVCPGRPFAFAVTDQGMAAAFTGLRLIAEYLRSGASQRALLLVVEQAARHHEVDPAAYPTGHTGVALVCEASGPARVAAVRQHTDVAPDQVAPLLTAQVEALPPDPEGGTPVLIADKGLAAAVGVPWAAVGIDQARIAPEGQPYTGVWWELTGALDGPTPPRRLVLGSYDRALRYLCLSGVDTASGPARLGVIGEGAGAWRMES